MRPLPASTLNARKKVRHIRYPLGVYPAYGEIVPKIPALCTKPYRSADVHGGIMAMFVDGSEGYCCIDGVNGIGQDEKFP